MAEDFLAKFTDSQNSARILRVFVFNQALSFTQAEAAKRAGVSANAAADEIKFLEKIDVIRKGKGA